MAHRRSARQPARPALRPLVIILLSTVLLTSGILGVLRATTYKEDLNGDGAVNIADVIKLILMARDNPSDPLVDYNADGKWSISDAISLILNIRSGNLTPLPEPVKNVTHKVSMKDYYFDPKDLTIAAGDTVQWVNEGRAGHTTTSGNHGVKDGKWDSGTMATGKTFIYVFTTAGVYPYYCIPHYALGMVGSITVK